MGILVLVLLVAAWGLVLGPALLRNSQDPSPIQTEKMFNRALRALGGPRKTKPVPGGRWVMVLPRSDYPSSPAGVPARLPAAERRRRNLTALAGFIIVTFLLGLVARPLRFLLFFNIVADIALVAYLVAAVYYAARPVQMNVGFSEEERPRPPAAADGR